VRRLHAELGRKISPRLPARCGLLAANPFSAPRNAGADDMPALGRLKIRLH
jgi:hypothetical protein